MTDLGKTAAAGQYTEIRKSISRTLVWRESNLVGRSLIFWDRNRHYRFTIVSLMFDLSLVKNEVLCVSPVDLVEVMPLGLIQSLQKSE